MSCSNLFRPTLDPPLPITLKHLCLDVGVPTQNRNKQKGHSIRDLSVPAHMSLRMFIMQVLVSQLPFLANRNAKLAFPLAGQSMT